VSASDQAQWDLRAALRTMHWRGGDAAIEMLADMASSEHDILALLAR
jgi:hypothetical protein